MRRRFVIQFHSAPAGAHYDLMLEAGEALATWRLDRLPAEAAGGQALPATALPDHRREYLTYEGPVSGGRGSVRIVDRGDCEIRARGRDEWAFELRGEKVRGAFSLRRLGGDRWELSPAGDPPERSGA